MRAEEVEEVAVTADVQDVAEDLEEETGEEAGDEAEEKAAGKGTGLRRLEEEGEVAADYLEELLDIVDVDGDIDIDVENGRAIVAIVSEDTSDHELRRLVGPKGEILEALQELARLAVQAGTGERSRLMLDIAGYRAGRRRALEDIAARACQEVGRTGDRTAAGPDVGLRAEGRARRGGRGRPRRASRTARSPTAAS